MSNEKLLRISEVFDTYIDGTREGSIKTFGVSSFEELIGKKFYFFRTDRQILFKLKEDGAPCPVETLLGQVTGVEFRFTGDAIELPEGKEWNDHVSEAKSISDLKGPTCMAYIITTLGVLHNYGCSREEPWVLDRIKNTVYGYEGTVNFI